LRFLVGSEKDFKVVSYFLRFVLDIAR
jgi:hypothetical protein